MSSATTQSLILEICPTTTQSWIASGALLVDVREQDEIAAAAFDVPNIIQIPLSEFEERFREIPDNQKVVVVCHSGDRSLRAAGFLINHGYRRDHVVNMKHGLLRWAQKGFPMRGSLEADQKGAACCSPESSQPKHSGKHNNCCE